jgi:hypothetical protein
MPEESELEIRQVFEAEDFGAALTPELREQEERLRAHLMLEPDSVRSVSARRKTKGKVSLVLSRS